METTKSLEEHKDDRIFKDISTSEMLELRKNWFLANRLSRSEGWKPYLWKRFERGFELIIVEENLEIWYGIGLMDFGSKRVRVIILNAMISCPTRNISLNNHAEQKGCNIPENKLTLSGLTSKIARIRMINSRYIGLVEKLNMGRLIVPLYIAKYMLT